MRGSIDVLRNLEEFPVEKYVSISDLNFSKGKTSKRFVIIALIGSLLTITDHILLMGFLFLVYGSVRLWSAVRKKRKEYDEARAADRELPIIAEKLLMAVRSGHDLVPAMLLIGKLGGEAGSSTKKFASLASRCERGERLELVLKEVANTARSIPLKHMCLHLSVAYREGGELSKPLEELSDATQNFIEEYENEEIAKMPVKATAPLVVIFLGLIITFITPPIMQIMKSMTEAAGK